MTIHIYQARLLHYLSESDRTERTPSKIANANQPDYAQVSTIDQSTTLLPVTAGERIYPEYIADGALVVDDVTGRIVEYGHSKTILSKYANAEGKPAVKVHDHRDKLIMPGFIDTHKRRSYLFADNAHGYQ